MAEDERQCFADFIEGKCGIIQQEQEVLANML
jgi:hypothetical protein